jgi:biotin carboxyl carrier protein
MKFIAEAGGRHFTIEISKSNGLYHLTWEDKSFNVDAIRKNRQSFSLLIEGKSYEVTLEKHGASFSVSFSNDTVRFNLIEARKFRASELVKKPGVSGKHEILAPMPGKIIKVAVAENGQVEEGDPLLIMEAMKMQNELKAPAPGIVKQVRVKEGEAVASQQVLLVLE